MEFILVSFFTFFLTLLVFAFTLFSLSCFSFVFTPVQQSTAWPPMLMRLFSYYRRDNPFQGPKEAYPWCLLSLLVFSFVLRGIFLIAGVRKTQETFHRHFI